jgi:YHS domain-containing protein
LLVGSALVTGAGAKQESTRTFSRAYLHSYNLPSSGLALEGYCPVTYFVSNEARPGKPEHTSTHNGVDYRFASADAKRTFDRNPEKYIPAYGGWCAYGMAIQNKFPIDPLNFKIVNGRLFLFLRNEKVDALAKWNEGDEQAQVVKANAYWKKVSQ